MLQAGQEHTVFCTDVQYNSSSISVADCIFVTYNTAALHHIHSHVIIKPSAMRDACTSLTVAATQFFRISPKSPPDASAGPSAPINGCNADCNSEQFLTIAKGESNQASSI